MEHVAEAHLRRPDGPLAGLVDLAVGYREVGAPPGIHRGLPSGSLTVVVPVGEMLHLAGHPDPSQGSASYEALGGGLHRSPALIRHDGHQEGIQLEVSPLGCRRLFGMPAGALEGVVVPLGDLIGRDAIELADRVNSTADWDARFAAVGEVFGRRLRVHDDPRSEPSAELARSWRRLVASDGTVRIEALAAEVGWSRRHLAARFGAEFGLSPKTAARILRFDRVRRLIVGPGALDLARAAAVAGYADQAHLTRDFRALAGCSPTRWLAEEADTVAPHLAETLTG